MSTRRLAIAAACVALAAPGTAAAGGGNYVFAGGTPAEQAQVRAALNASTFNWSVVPAQITIVIGYGVATSQATPGQITLDAAVLDMGRFSWGTVQHEYAHQVDFYLLDDAGRAQLQKALGATDWCYETAGLPHSAHGCERFASTLAWSYWQSPENTLAPRSPVDEAGAMPPAAFRALLAQLIGAQAAAPAAAAASATAKVKPAAAGKAKFAARR